jgi:hypothetical protein
MVMSERAKEFLREFNIREVKPITYPEIPKIVKLMHDICIEAASQRGITKSELQEAAGGNLKRFLIRAFEDAEDQAVREKALKENMKQLDGSRRRVVRVLRKPTKSR